MVVRTLGCAVIDVSSCKERGYHSLRLSFTGTLRVIRRAIPKFQRLQSQELPFLSWLTVEILDTLLPERVSRTNPRVVKTCIQVSLKKPRHQATLPNQSSYFLYPQHSVALNEPYWALI
ncbi:MAG: hypothetical protein N4J56_002348 [Chroococcidiopsis sp. SAG 2025]|nr:hypothetical protein [Chroococcidiopsis sp. SAG 2025]